MHSKNLFFPLNLSASRGFVFEFGILSTRSATLSFLSLRVYMCLFDQRWSSNDTRLIIIIYDFNLRVDFKEFIVAWKYNVLRTANDFYCSFFLNLFLRYFYVKKQFL